MAEHTLFTFGSQIQINFSGNINDAIVESFDGSILTLSVNRESRSYIVDLDSQSIYDNAGNNGFFYQALPSMENLMSNPSTRIEDIDSVVWRMVRGEVPTCHCDRCTLDNIQFLRHAARSPPEPSNMNIVLACVHIVDSMIPRMTERIMGSLNNLIAMIAGPNDIMSQVLEASMADAPKRHAAKAEVVCSLDDIAHPYDSSQKCDTCTICMEKFPDIEAETKAPVMVITCPGCESSFCAGKSCEGEKNEDQCQGFKYLMEKYDNRCPICRMAVKDWMKDNAMAVESASVSTEETSSAPTYDIDHFFSGSMTGVSMIDPEPYPAGHPLLDRSGSMSGVPLMVSIDIEIPDISSRRNHRHRNRDKRKKYPPMNWKTPYKSARQKRRNKMRHNRQYYGR